MKKFDFVIGQKVLILPAFSKEGEYPDTFQVGKIATVTSVENFMCGEITLPDGGVYLAFSDEIEAVEQSVQPTRLRRVGSARSRVRKNTCPRKAANANRWADPEGE